MNFHISCLCFSVSFSVSFQSFFVTDVLIIIIIVEKPKIFFFFKRIMIIRMCERSISNQLKFHSPVHHYVLVCHWTEWALSIYPIKFLSLNSLLSNFTLVQMTTGQNNKTKKVEEDSRNGNETQYKQQENNIKMGRLKKERKKKEFCDGRRNS